MAKTIKTCRVCGKKYEACGTPNLTNKFRWKDVACCVECGEEYLRRILESRGQTVMKETTQNVEPEEELLDEDEDEELDEEEDDEEDFDALDEDDEELSFESSDIDE